MRNIVYIFMMLSMAMTAQEDSFGDVAIGVGASTYFGDMDSGNTISDLFYSSFAIQLRYSYHHNNYFTTNANLLIGGLKGDDKRSENEGRLRRNLNFHSPLTEFSIIEEIHPLGKGMFEGKTKLSPYLLLGISGYYFNPKTEDSQGNTHALQPLGTEGQGAEGYEEPYKLYRLSIPFGGGLKFKINQNMAVSSEIMSRYTGFDYLDDLSTSYAPRDVLLSNGGEAAVELSDRREEPTYSGIRGDVNDLDYYFTFMINFHFRLQSQNRISGVKNPTIR